MSDWYINVRDETLGPLPESTVNKMIRTSFVTASTKVKRDKWDAWGEAHEFTPFANRIDAHDSRREHEPLFFTYRGRIGRLSFLLQSLIPSAIGLAGLYINYPDSLYPNPEIPVWISTHGTGYLLLLLSSFLGSFPIVRRFHDANYSGTMWFGSLIPFVAPFFALLLQFEKGTDGPNKYGPPPKW
jgi:uncharacterized membrane protein YhaH (DUF805 family)